MKTIEIEDCNDIKTNDLVAFKNFQADAYIRGVIVNNDEKRKIICIKWFGFRGQYSMIPSFNTTLIKYDNLETHDFMRLGTPRYETIYKPAFSGVLMAYGMASVLLLLDWLKYQLLDLAGWSRSFLQRTLSTSPKHCKLKRM